MLKKTLVANRGEIACRIIRTLRQEQIATVAVYHHEDRHAPHVSMADVAVELEADVPTAAYLDQAQIIDVAHRTEVDAIHPGYGFLSENAGFAERVESSGIVFIGPSAAAIRMSDFAPRRFRNRAISGRERSMYCAGVDSWSTSRALISAP